MSDFRVSGFRADLHCHTTCSDGTDAPEALLRKAVRLGLKGLSITDHDTIDAYTPGLFALAKELSLRLLPGIELSSEWGEISIHVLGYGIDLNSAQMREFLIAMNLRRSERNAQILEKLRLKGFPIHIDELHAFGLRTLGRPHIAEIMVRKGYVRSTQEAFELYLKDGGSCYVSGVKIKTSEVIEQIHAAHGKAVLAHPHFLRGRVFLNSLLSLPFDGIECYYGNLSPQQEEQWVKLAKTKGLIATGGSDYHGAVKPQIELGVSWVSEEIFCLLGGR